MHRYRNHSLFPSISIPFHFHLPVLVSFLYKEPFWFRGPLISRGRKTRTRTTTDSGVSKGSMSSMEVRSRRPRNPSPDRAKICQQKVISFKKLQVVYYLTRNGLLEHPHSMEVSLLPNEPLRLKHVLDRLISLRGSGMPSLYSWSCKRSYKSGYVWYDLGVNDIIHPADGAEYVLKGSELLPGCSERFQQLRVSVKDSGHNHNHQDLNLKRNKPAFQSSPNREGEEYQEYEGEEEEEQEEYEDGDKTTSYTSSTTTPHSRCSRGVSTDELDKVVPLTENHSSKRPEHEAETETTSRNNSVLLQLIACGSSAVSKAKNAPCMSNLGKKKEIESERERENNVMRRKNGSLHRVAVRKSAEKFSSEAEMINYMSENPRFGNSQSEEKEYFSGSLVESMKAQWDAAAQAQAQAQAQPVLKKSNSYNEQRIKVEEEEEEEKEEKREKKGKCIPRSKRSSGSSKVQITKS